jgi:hypothetical protein
MPGPSCVAVAAKLLYLLLAMAMLAAALQGFEAKPSRCRSHVTGRKSGSHYHWLSLVSTHYHVVIKVTEVPQPAVHEWAMPRVLDAVLPSDTSADE